MSKRLILILALAFVVGLCATTYAAVQNVKVGGDITEMGVLRNSLTLQKNQNTAGYRKSISALLSQVRVRIDADLTDNVATTVRLLNERVWGEEDDTAANSGVHDDDSDINLDLAYVILKEFLYSPLTLTVGRQELRFGNGLIIGDPDTNGLAGGPLPVSVDDLSARKAFDAIRATLNYDPLIVDLVLSKIDENAVDVNNDVDLYGVNANYALNKDLTVEGYFFQRTRDTGSIGIAVDQGPEKTRVVGARGVYSGIENMVLGLEGAYQFGDHISSTTLYPDDARTAGTPSKVNAYALQAVANYVFPKMKYTPSLRATYTYLSGDKYLSVKDNYTGWSAMFEDQAGGTIYNKILGFSNAQLVGLSGSMKPTDDVTATLDYTYLKLNYPYNDLATSIELSGVLGDPTYIMTNAKSLGHEVDLKLTYDYTEDVQFGLNAGAFIPGEAFSSQNSRTATQVIGSMKVTF